MEKFLRAFISFADTINENIGKITAWLTTVLVLVVCSHVFMRRILDTNPAWITELEWHIFALIFLFGAGYAFKHDKHVRVDLFYANFSKKDKALVNLVGTLLFLIPWCILIIIYSFEYAMTSYEIGEGSPDPGGLPARYLIKFSITIGVVFLLLQAIAILFRSIITLNGQDELDNNQQITNH